MLMLDAAGVSYQIVLTKTDKLGANELALVTERTRAEITPRAAAHPEIHLTSALKRRGLAALRATLASFALPTATPTTVAAPVLPR
jgi:GTP-binding protein